MDVLTYYRKMKKLDLALQTIFSDKERYLLTKQNCFILDSTDKEAANKEKANASATAHVNEDYLDSDREDGPKRSQKWWEGIQSWNTMRLMDGLTGEIKSRRSLSARGKGSNASEVSKPR